MPTGPKRQKRPADSASCQGELGYLILFYGVISTASFSALAYEVKVINCLFSELQSVDFPQH
jgi:hypothetical protein